MTDALSAAIESILRTDDLSEEIHQAQINTLRGAYDAALAQPQDPVAWRWTESNGKYWADWRTDWTHYDRAKELGFPVEYAYPNPPQRKPLSKAQIYKAYETALGKKLPNMGASRTELIAIARAVESAHGIK